MRWMLHVLLVLVVGPGASVFGQGQNAAVNYRAAFTALGISGFGAPGTGLLTDEDQNFIADLVSPVLTPAAHARLEALFIRIGAPMEDILEGSRARASDWELKRAGGFGVPLPHLTAMRTAARLLRARTLMAVSDGDHGAAVGALGAIGRLGAHAGQDRLGISSLVGSAVGSLFANATGAAIEAGAVNQGNAQRLLDAVAALKRPDPFGYADAMRGEYAMLAAQLNGGGVDETIAFLGDANLDAAAREQLRAPERVQGLLRQARGLYERAAAAMENPDPVAARREMQEIEGFVESGRAGPILKLVFPAFGRMLEAKLKSEQEITLLLERLQSIADGRASPAELQNAALLLYRAALAAAAASADAQDAVELLRVAPGALDAEGAARATALLERARATVLEPLAAAAALRRCDFAVLRLHEPSLDVPLLGGLRAATRMALADGLRASRAARAPAAAARAAATAYRVAALLAQDPTLARAHVAQSIWMEATAALAEALRLGALGEEDTAIVERALGTMTTQDAFGWRRGLEADVARLVEHGARQQASAMTPEIREMRLKVHRQRGANATFARVAMIVAGRGTDDALPRADAPVLERLTDLWPPAAVAAAVAAHDAARAANEAAGRTRVEVSIFDVPLDLPLEEQRALLRKHDPVRGVVFVDVPAAQSEGATAYLRAFEVLRAAPPARDPGTSAAPAAPPASPAPPRE
jgi:hypothetical protein